MPVDPTTDLVTADMERIFGQLAGRSEIRPLSFRREDECRSDVITGRRTIWYAIMALIVIAVLGSVLISNRATSLTAFAQDRVFQSANRSQAAAVVQSSQLQQIDAQHAVASPSDVFRQVDDAIVGPVPSESGDNGNPIMAKPMAITSDRPLVSPGRLRISKNTPRKRPPNRIGAAPRVFANENPKPTSYVCPPDSTDNKCIYQDVIYADTTLRVAFNRAKDAGVSTSFLAAVSSRWQKALRRSLDDPDGTIDRYNQLARTLDGQREDMRP